MSEKRPSRTHAAKDLLLAEHSATIQRLAVEVQELKDSLARVTADRARRQDTITQKNHAIAGLDTQIRKLVSKCDVLTTGNASASDKIAELSGRLNASAESNEQKDVAIMLAEDKIKDLTLVITEHDSEANCLRMQLQGAMGDTQTHKYAAEKALMLRAQDACNVERVSQGLELLKLGLNHNRGLGRQLEALIKLLPPKG